MDWNMVTAIATTFSTLVTAISIFLVWLQLRKMGSSQDVTIALTLFDRSTSPEMLEASLWVKTQMPPDFGYSDFQRDLDARQKLEKLWYYFEFLGVMANQRYVAEDVIFDQQGAFIAGVWDRTSHLVYARRKDRNSPQYLESASRDHGGPELVCVSGVPVLCRCHRSVFHRSRQKLLSALDSGGRYPLLLR